MLTPHVIPVTSGTCHPNSARQIREPGNHALAQRIRRSRQGSATLYERGQITVAGIDYVQGLMPVLYGADKYNADLQ